MKKVMLISIPHTGTVFVSEFLEHVMGLKHIKDPQEFMETDNMNVFMRIHTSTPIQEWKNPLFDYAEENCHVVSPIRHPYENAVSCYARQSSNPAFAWMNWNIMMATAPRYNIFWVDIDTKYRHNMMNQLCTFLERKPQSKELYDRYVDKWQKVNRVPKHNAIRKAYNETGILPKGIKRDLFDDAVAWFDELKESIDKQYALADGYGTVASNHSKEGSTPSKGAKQTMGS